VLTGCFFWWQSAIRSKAARTSAFGPRLVLIRNDKSADRKNGSLRYPWPPGYFSRNLSLGSDSGQQGRQEGRATRQLANEDVFVTRVRAAAHSPQAIERGNS